VAKLKDHRADGFMQFQMKVGEHPDVDIERMRAVCGELRDDEVLAADANTGWKQHEAIRVMQSTADLPLYIEQPCLSYEECLVVRQHTMQPMILDECMDSLRTLLRGVADGATDLINLKISRAGGLARARQIRDLCVSLGIVMTIEDTWGGEIATAAIAHLAADLDELRQIAALPIEKATTLPGRFYTDPAIFELEKQVGMSWGWG
jgi:cis-L-3-hydroxyproline dehydratase